MLVLQSFPKQKNLSSEVYAMETIQTNEQETLQFYPHRVFRQNDKVFLYNVNTAGFFEIDEPTAGLLKQSGKSREEVYEMFADVWNREQLDNLLQDMEQGLILQTEENQQQVRQMLDHYTQRPVSSLTLFMIQECNLRCSYCYAGDGEYNDKGRMTTEVAKQAVDYLIQNSGDWKQLGLVFFGGEPLMNFPLVQETVLYAREREKESGKQFMFSMTSNGTLITDTIQAFLEEHKIQVQISIDGDEETHNHNRFYNGRVGSYDKVIERTQDMRDKNALIARATVSGKELDLIHTFDHLVELGFRTVAMSPAANLLSDDDYKKLVVNNIALVKEFERLANEGDYAKAKKMSNVTKMLNKIHVGGTRSHFCGAGTNMFAVDIHGNLYPCHRFVSEKDYAVGNVFFGTSAKHEQFLDEVHVTNRTTCNSCWARNLCTGGCHHENLVANGTTQTPAENYCMTTRAVFHEAMHLYLRMPEEQKRVFLGV
jgi:uncharacterized protein